MGYVTINTKVPENLAEEFKKFAEANGVTVSTALKLLILEKLKKPDSKLLPFWNLLKELYQRIDLNLALVYLVLSNVAGLMLLHKPVIKDKEQAEYALKLEKRLETMMDIVHRYVSQALNKDREMLGEFEMFLKVLQQEEDSKLE